MGMLSGCAAMPCRHFKPAGACCATHRTAAAPSRLQTTTPAFHPAIEKPASHSVTHPTGCAHRFPPCRAPPGCCHCSARPAERQCLRPPPARPALPRGAALLGAVPHPPRPRPVGRHACHLPHRLPARHGGSQPPPTQPGAPATWLFGGRARRAGGAAPDRRFLCAPAAAVLGVLGA